MRLWSSSIRNSLNCPYTKRYIHDIRRKKAHILSNAEEKIMAAAGEMAQAPDEIYGLLNNADMTFPDITDSNGKQLHVTHGSFIPLLQILM